MHKNQDQNRYVQDENKMNKQIRNVTFPVLSDTLLKLRTATGKDTIKAVFETVIEDYLNENKVR